ncbi:hypothetical protein [Devosia sp.]|uniref:phage adaptor protein n=1 Tax=Devosia sp. TaxID=1871048 RepID=UPI002AFE7B7F|nr:hypothetical protein [Devosia sp.]
MSNYAELQAQALDFMERQGQAGKAADWIALAEARLNRKLGAVETDALITGVIGSRSINVSSLAMVQPIALYLAVAGNDELPILPRAEGTFPYRATPGAPQIWAVNSNDITFDCPVDQSYPFRLRFRQRFALATSNTNWLLANHPDLYLAATIMWGAGYNEDWNGGSIWKGLLDEGLREVRSEIAKNKISVATLDPALGMFGRGGGAR